MITFINIPKLDGKFVKVYSRLYNDGYRMKVFSCQALDLSDVHFTSFQGWWVWLQNGSDWPQMGQIWVFFRSDFSAFGAGAPNALESDLKKPLICKPTIPACVYC